ncbi:MAG: hypothetical protein Fur0022_40810 [Anaerolineales bacterium]
MKRPDIAFFCRKPAEEEEAITQLPEAGIEIISKSYEVKDLPVTIRLECGWDCQIQRQFPS